MSHRFFRVLSSALVIVYVVAPESPTTATRTLELQIRRVQMMLWDQVEDRDLSNESPIRRPFVVRGLIATVGGLYPTFQ